MSIRISNIIHNGKDSVLFNTHKGLWSNFTASECLAKFPYKIPKHEERHLLGRGKGLRRAHSLT